VIVIGVDIVIGVAIVIVNMIVRVIVIVIVIVINRVEVKYASNGHYHYQMQKISQMHSGPMTSKS
jgi:hypothetical protein